MQNDDAPIGSIVITPKEFYDGVKSDIGEINNNVQGLRNDMAGVPARVLKLEAKVENLSTKMTYAVGFAAGLSATGSYLVSKFVGG
jgi:hypothetical protein